ncbi:MAG: B12-binding domain-containing radical SAM protein [Acidobacteriia bacterium]|nr:B12-binding domain-containing radical SAM protein [Terriglobia bacterium]
MDLLLTHGYFLEEDPKEREIMKPYVPLGILYLASHLRSRNFDVEVFDSTFSTSEQLIRLLETTQPTVLGVYANLMTRKNVVRILRAAKDAGWKTVVGGPEPAAYTEEYLAAGADVVVIGEGEITLEELLPVVRGGSQPGLSDIHGIAFRGEDGKVFHTPARALIPNIDRQPWPSRESVPIERYLETWRKHHGLGSVSLITARGCPYECQWCSHAVFGTTHRRRKPVSVVDELEWILDRYNPDMLWFADDVFTIHHGWLEQFAAEMRRRSLRIPFECISRADRLNSRIVDLLAELDCFRIWIGSESGSQRVLDAMRRGVTVEQVQSAVELCKAKRIETGMFLMWGYEGEGLQEIEETIHHVKRCMPDIFLTTVAYPIRGTPYFAEVADRVVNPSRWAESSDRSFEIKGRHSRRFYQNADQLLRAEVELEKLSQSITFGTNPAVAELRHKIEQSREGLQSIFSEVEA